jgi:hypothetical protein
LARKNIAVGLAKYGKLPYHYHMADHRTLTLADLDLLSDLYVAGKGHANARWAVGGELDNVTTGVIRGIRNGDTTMLLSDQDVRDAFVWISGIIEWQIPVRTVLAQMRGGTFVIQD